MSITVTWGNVQLNCPATGGPHRFTVAVESEREWRSDIAGAQPYELARVTRLRCESCPEEVSR